MAKIEIYDTTLRDGTQQEGVSLSVEDKLKIARKLDEMGIDFIEGGWPGANPKDAEFFLQAQLLDLKHAKLAAFCSTRRANGSAETDATLRHALDAKRPSSRWSVRRGNARHPRTGDQPGRNLAMIADSVAFFKGHGKTVLLDAEHFLTDSRQTRSLLVQAASDAGADTVVLWHQRGALPHGWRLSWRGARGGAGGGARHSPAQRWRRGGCDALVGGDGRRDAGAGHGEGYCERCGMPVLYPSSATCAKDGV